MMLLPLHLLYPLLRWQMPRRFTHLLPLDPRLLVRFALDLLLPLLPQLLSPLLLARLLRGSAAHHART
jgi:hypothetical protein